MSILAQKAPAFGIKRGKAKKERGIRTAAALCGNPEGMGRGQR
jgi:hypothetical protein